MIGMGRVGPGLASAFRAAGFTISGVAVRRPESEERVDAALPGIPVVSAQQVARDSEVLILAVGNEDIEPLTKKLVEEQAIHPGQVTVHLAGGMGLEPLASAAAVGALPIAMHPVMEFSGTSLDVSRLQGTPVAYTCSPVAVPLAISLIESIGAIPFEVDNTQRREFFDAIIAGTEGLRHVVTEALDALSKAGIADPKTVLAPILRSSLGQVLEPDSSGE